MFNLQGSEIIVILLLALVVLGPEKLPDAVRRFGKTYAELKKMGNGFQSELRQALDEPVKEMRETANLLRDAADPNKLVAEAEAEERLAKEAAQSGADGLGDPPGTKPVTIDRPRMNDDADGLGALDRDLHAPVNGTHPPAVRPPGPAFHSAAPPKTPLPSPSGAASMLPPPAGAAAPLAPPAGAPLETRPPHEVDA